MKCLDDCHNYELDTVARTFHPQINFYRMGKNFNKDGVINEEVIKVLIHRINYLNDGEFKCRENSLAITKLEEALMWLNKRTENRIARGVEGSLTP